MEIKLEIGEEIRQYLAQVAVHLRKLPEDEQSDILEEVERHIHDALSKRAEGQPTLAELKAVLAEMDPPESYGRTDDDTAKPKSLPIAQRVKPSAKPDLAHGDRPALIRASVRAAIIHALMPLGLFMFLVYKVPKLSIMFEELDVELPTLTRLMLSWSNFLKHYWPLAFLLLLIFLAADTVIYFLLRRHVGKLAGGGWYAFGLLFETACVGFCYIATVLPMQTIITHMDP